MAANDDPNARLSLSLRRAWIEITSVFASGVAWLSRSPYGERGLKYLVQCLVYEVLGRSPYGERGLKSTGTPKGVELTHAVALLTESVD